ncbi:WSSV279 [White spot syndrome virus]|uniref:WSSV279 n=1 Tax=White spot syndrome virus TaxID=342409 RepID=A0A2I6SC02_9VIRU|nr:WSSV279 [White spot syndrome virus]
MTAAELNVATAQSAGHQYMNAGHCPEPGIKQMLLPDCIMKLKSIAMEKGRGGDRPFTDRNVTMPLQDAEVFILQY